MCVCFSECICLTSYVLAQLCCDETTFTGCTSRSLLSLRPDSSLSVCSSSRQPDSHRSPAQMPWPTLHVCKRVCEKKCACVCSCVCVCVCAPPASPQQDCQSVCDYTPTHLRLFCFLTIPSPLPLASIFAARPFTVFNILIKSAMFHTGE